MKPVLSFERIKSRILADAGDHGLAPYAVRTTVEQETLMRTLTFCAVPSGWAAPHHRHVQVELSVDATHMVASDDPEALTEEANENAAELEIQVTYQLLGASERVELRALEAHVQPLVQRINRTLGGEPRPVYYTVSTDYRERHFPVEAKVYDLYTLDLRPEGFETSFLAEIAVALGTIAPE